MRPGSATKRFAARNTFIVQKNKAIIPDFDRWPQVKTRKNFPPFPHPCTDPMVSPRTR
jgi:hypothetical protein